jgi:hypothetical protein
MTLYAPLGRGSAGHFLTALFGAVSVCVPAAVIGGAAYAFSFDVARDATRNALRWVSTMCLAVLIPSALVVISYLPGRAVAAHDVVKAKRYCERLIPLLDAHRARTGSYPATIDEFLPEHPRPPLLLRRDSFYHGDADSFIFEFYVDDSLFFGSYRMLDGTERRWRRVD